MPIVWHRGFTRHELTNDIISNCIAVSAMQIAAIQVDLVAVAATVKARVLPCATIYWV